MKYLSTAMALVFTAAQLYSQTPFEGIIQYKIDVKSRVQGIADISFRRAMALGETMTLTIQDGKYKRESGPATEYYVPAEKRWYFVLKGIDTLFYRDYSEDTSAIPKVIPGKEKKQVAGYNCNSVALKTADHLQMYYYAPDLYLDPAQNAVNTMDHIDVYTNATHAAYLSGYDETPTYIATYEGVKVQPGKIAPEVFHLPDLPVRHFEYSSITTPPEFKGAQGFNRFVAVNIDKEVMKYIKVPRGEKHVRQEVRVVFTLDDHGQIIKTHVLNPDGLHKKLVQEAVRVVMLSSGKWKAGKMAGVPIFFTLTQPVTFDLTVE